MKIINNSYGLIFNILLAALVLVLISACAAPPIIQDPRYIDFHPPTQPTNLKATAFSISQINLSWEASVDTFGVSTGVKGYYIYRDGKKLRKTAQETKFSDTGLEPGKSYSYTVEAYDNGMPFNTSLMSKPASAATPKPKYPAFLSIEELKFIEPSGNQSLDGLETGKITFDLINKGKGDAFGIEVNIIPMYSGENLEYNSKTTIEKINSKSSQTIEIVITADSKTQSMDRSFRIEVTEYFGFDTDPTDISFTTTAIPQPDLRIVHTVIDDDEEGDSYGNGNSLIEPGESIEVIVGVQNFGDGSAEDVKAEVIFNTSDINISYPDEGQIYSLGDFSVEQTKEFKFYFFTNRRYSTVNLPISVNLTESKGDFGKIIDVNLTESKGDFER